MLKALVNQLTWPHRTSLSLVVMTTKHFPHWEWSSDGGAGEFDGPNRCCAKSAGC